MLNSWMLTFPPLTFFKVNLETAIFWVLLLALLKNLTESRRFSLVMKSTKMEYTWPEYCIGEYSKKLLWMIMCRAHPRDNFMARSQPEEMKFGWWFSRNAGRNFLDRMMQSMVKNRLFRWTSTWSFESFFCCTDLQLPSNKRPIVIVEVVDEDLVGRW